MRDAKVRDYGGTEVSIQVDRYPDECPFCHRKISMLPFHTGTKNNKQVEIIFRCTNYDCQKLFIAYYQDVGSNSKAYWAFHRTAPSEQKSVEFPQPIIELSPTFVSIYQEAFTVEQLGMSQICGVGYRRALEFLVKDYAIHKHSEEEGNVKKKALGNCIKDYIADVRIKAVAERAAWLGNDETHYVRKWETKDVDDLKLLIRLTVLWIELEVETERIQKEMPG